MSKKTGLNIDLQPTLFAVVIYRFDYGQGRPDKGQKEKFTPGPKLVGGGSCRGGQSIIETKNSTNITDIALEEATYYNNR